MATEITSSYTDSNSNDAWQSLVNKRLLMRATYNHFCMMFTEKNPLAMRSGKTMMFRRYAAPAKQTTALTEGVTPTSLAKSKTDVAITMAQYGAWYENSDFLEQTLPEGTLDDVDQLSQNMGETMDLLYAIMWGTSTNVVYSNGSAENAVNTLAVYEDYNKLVRMLRINKAKRTARIWVAYGPITTVVRSRIFTPCSGPGIRATRSVWRAVRACDGDSSCAAHAERAASPGPGWSAGCAP